MDGPVLVHRTTAGHDDGNAFISELLLPKSVVEEVDEAGEEVCDVELCKDKNHANYGRLVSTDQTA